MLNLVLLSLAQRLDLKITRQVRGAAYPVNGWNTECSQADLTAEPCSCFGGASRRIATLNSDADAVKLDLGGHASGSGLFFPAFGGQAAARFIAASGYDALGLDYRDFAAGVNFNRTSEATGGRWLAIYIDTLRSLDPTLPPAVVTNIDLSNDPFLSAAVVNRTHRAPAGHISPFALVPLPDNRTLAFLHLVDPRHLHPLSPHYASRVFAFDQAIHSALASLRRLEGGPPDIIALSIADIPSGPLPRGFPDLLLRHGTSDGALAKEKELRSLVSEAIGVDVVLLGLGE